MTVTHCLPTGTLGTGELPIPNVGTSNIAVMEPAGAARGVVVLLHGLQSVIHPVKPEIIDVDGWLTGLTLTLATDLNDDDWVVIMPQFSEAYYVGQPIVGIYEDVTNDAGHGARYVDRVLRWWDHVIEWIKANYGPWPIVPFGSSWGGWHALHIAAGRPSTLTAYVAHHPATVVSEIEAIITTPVDFTTEDTSGCDTFSTMLNAVTIPGAIGWGTLDTITPPANIEAIFDAAFAAGRPVVSNEQANGHELDAADVAFYTGWFTSTVDPLAPAVH